MGGRYPASAPSETATGAVDLALSGTLLTAVASGLKVRVRAADSAGTTLSRTPSRPLA